VNPNFHRQVRFQRSSPRRGGQFRWPIKAINSSNCHKCFNEILVVFQHQDVAAKRVHLSCCRILACFTEHNASITSQPRKCGTQQRLSAQRSYRKRREARLGLVGTISCPMSKITARCTGRFHRASSPHVSRSFPCSVVLSSTTSERCRPAMCPLQRCH
jgi:hypothetical protein